MRISKLSIGLAVVWGLLAPCCVQARAVGNVSAQELVDIFKSYDYDNYLYAQKWDKSQWSYPEVLVESLPKDYLDIPSEMEQRRLFMMILIPLSLKINQEIADEREVISHLNYKNKNEALDDVDRQMIDGFASKYDVFTREKGKKRYDVLLEELSVRVDGVPPSILIAAAAINTNWGKAKFVPYSNNLYRQLVWYSNQGLKPHDDENAQYRIKIFPSLYDSMGAFALEVNSSVNFETFRYMRTRLRYREKYLSGHFLVPYVIFANPLENFAGMMDYLITFYRLEDVDKKAVLGQI